MQVYSRGRGVKATRAVAPEALTDGSLARKLSPSPLERDRRLRVGLVFSTEVGLRTQYLNWHDALTEQGVAEAAGIDPHWIRIDWWKENGAIEKIPLIPHGIRGKLRGMAELREGMRQGPFDFLFIAALPAFYLQPGLLDGQRYFVALDATERQQYAFGSLYKKRSSRLAQVERAKHARRTKLFQGAIAYFPWSRWAARGLQEDYGIPEERLHILPPGIPLERWRCDRDSRPREHAETQILFVGGDFYRKGGDLLLDWARRTGKKNWRLHLVTRDAVSDLPDRVSIYQDLRPNDPRLIALYQQADLFALPTRGDCYSIASIEAMASGLPVVLSDVGGTADILREGETGYLLPPGDGDALAQRLDHLLTYPELALRMGKAARRDAEERYDHRKTSTRVLQAVQRHLTI